MTESFETDRDSKEDNKMGSKNHALVQSRLATYINITKEENYNAATELSLDVSEANRQKILKKFGILAKRELKPDVAVYLADQFDFVDPDEEDEEACVDPLRVKEMPLCVMEIVSQSQSSVEIVAKCRAYFQMGVKSCWLIDPCLKLVVVYQGQIRQKKAYLEGGETVVADEVLGVKIPLTKIFGRRGAKVTPKMIPSKTR